MPKGLRLVRLIAIGAASAALASLFVARRHTLRTAEAAVQARQERLAHAVAASLAAALARARLAGDSHDPLEPWLEVAPEPSDHRHDHDTEGVIVCQRCLDGTQKIFLPISAGGELALRMDVLSQTLLASAAGKGDTVRLVAKDGRVLASAVPAEIGDERVRERSAPAAIRSSVDLPWPWDEALPSKVIVETDPEMALAMVSNAMSAQDLAAFFLVFAAAAGIWTISEERRRHATAEALAAKRQLEAEKRATAADRLATLGTLASGVAHEVNNPLTVLLASLRFLREQGDWSGENGEAIADAMDAADRIRLICSDMTAAAHAGDDRIPTDLNLVIAASLRLTAAQLRSKGDVLKELEAIPRVLASAPRLTQVFTNLLVNAAQATPDGPGQRIRIASRREGGLVSVEICDTGSGIDAAIAQRIFDPFYTTKPPGKGTGLGLWVCRQIVEAHGGRIGLAQTPGYATTFRVELPVEK